MARAPRTPFLPKPLAGDVLAALSGPFATIDAGEARHARLGALREQVSAAIDTIDLAIATNHADYLAGRPCWTYEISIEVKERLRVLKRQRQHLQDAMGQCARRVRRLQYDADHAARDTPPREAQRAQAFVAVAQQVLAPETLALLWEVVDKQGASSTLPGPDTPSELTRP